MQNWQVSEHKYYQQNYTQAGPFNLQINQSWVAGFSMVQVTCPGEQKASSLQRCVNYTGLLQSRQKKTATTFTGRL